MFGRPSDTKPIELGHEASADGRWPLYMFADSADPQSQDSPIAELCRFLAEDPNSLVLRHTPAGADLGADFEVRAAFQQGHRHLHPPRHRPRPRRNRRHPPPDQYVASVLPVAAYARLAEFSRRLCSLSAELAPATSRSPSPRYGCWHSL
ncbi:hypothetical protein ACTL7K_10825, partial [Brevibacterium linens]